MPAEPQITDLSHMRILRPAPHILAFYDGRAAAGTGSAQGGTATGGAEPGSVRPGSVRPGGAAQEIAPNGTTWLGECLALGIASYAVISGNEALIYDTHLSLAHAQFIRDHLESLGVDTFVVVLSHWHIDHVAGTDVFADSTIIANKRTAAHLARHRAAFEAGTYKGLPAIKPLVMPTHTFERGAHIHVGRLHIDLIECNIHSDDATVVHLKSDGILLAGDTLEDPVTYVCEPQALATHLADLDRLAALNPRLVLPNHADPGRIAAGGYGPGLIAATQGYLWKLIAARTDASLRDTPLQDWLAEDLAAGTLIWWPAYEDVHRQNLQQVMNAG